MEELCGDVDALSAVEAIKIIEIILFYSQLQDFDMGYIYILYPYTVHCTLLQKCLHPFHPPFCQKTAVYVIYPCVSIVATAQGLQNCLVNYSRETSARSAKRVDRWHLVFLCVINKD